jgi:hypothetical protein
LFIVSELYGQTGQLKPMQVLRLLRPLQPNLRFKHDAKHKSLTAFYRNLS